MERTRVQTPAVVYVCSVLVPCAVLGVEPEVSFIAKLRDKDAAAMPEYALKVAVEEPAYLMFEDHRSLRMECRMTRERSKFAAACQTQTYPDPAYHAPETHNTQGADYDDDGSLGTPVRLRWVSRITQLVNETYEEYRSLYVSPDQTVTDAGPLRILNLYQIDDQGASSWSYSAVRRCWWALGHDFARHLLQVETRQSVGGERGPTVARGLYGSFPGGRWYLNESEQDAGLIREARFVRDLDFRPLVLISNSGSRRFGHITLAQEGVVQLPRNDKGDAIETRVFLIDFAPNVDRELLREVDQILDGLKGEEIRVHDFRADPNNPTFGSFGSVGRDR